MSANSPPEEQSGALRTPEKETLRCGDFNQYPDKPNCCGSCHDDIDEGYAEPVEIDLPNGKHFIGCCTMAGWLEKHT